MSLLPNILKICFHCSTTIISQYALLQSAGKFQLNLEPWPFKILYLAAAENFSQLSPWCLYNFNNNNFLNRQIISIYVEFHCKTDCWSLFFFNKKGCYYYHYLNFEYLVFKPYVPIYIPIPPTHNPNIFLYIRFLVTFWCLSVVRTPGNFLLVIK